MGGGRPVLAIFTIYIGGTGVVRGCAGGILPRRRTHVDTRMYTLTSRFQKAVGSFLSGRLASTGVLVEGVATGALSAAHICTDASTAVRVPVVFGRRLAPGLLLLQAALAHTHAGVRVVVLDSEVTVRGSYLALTVAPHSLLHLLLHRPRLPQVDRQLECLKGAHVDGGWRAGPAWAATAAAPAHPDAGREEPGTWPSLEHHAHLLYLTASVGHVLLTPPLSSFSVHSGGSVRLRLLSGPGLQVLLCVLVLQKLRNPRNLQQLLEAANTLELLLGSEGQLAQVVVTAWVQLV